MCYPHLSHINNLKRDPKAEISEEAYNARQRGEPIKIEHVQPQRAFAKEIIRIVEDGGADDDIIKYIGRNYRLVLLTHEETKKLDRQNRSQITRDRIAEAGITLRNE